MPSVGHGSDGTDCSTPLGKFESAINNYDKLVLIMEELGYSQEWIRGNLKRKAYAMSIMGDYAGASKIYKNNLELYEKLDDKENIIYTLVSLGINCYNDKKYENALDYLEKSQSMQKEIEIVETEQRLIYELPTVLYLNLSYKYFGQKYDLTKIQELIKQSENISYRTNFRLYELLEDRTYLETAYNQIQDEADAMADDQKEKFLNCPIPKNILEEWEKTNA